MTDVDEGRNKTLRGLLGGSVAGLAAGLLGIGGGLLMVPLMVLGFGLPLKRAVGTSLLGVVAIATVAVVTEALTYPDNVHLLPAGLLALGAITGSWLGARLITATPPLLLSRLLALMLALAALKMLGVLDSFLPDVGQAHESSSLSASLILAHVATGLGAGVLSSLFGIGGGILAVPLLALLHPDWTFHSCRATSLVMIVPTAIAGAVLHRKLEHLDTTMAKGLVPGAMVGSIAGVLLANQVAARPLECLFAALLIYSALRMGRRKA